MIESQQSLGEIFKALEDSQFLNPDKTQPLQNSNLNKNHNKVTLQKKILQL